MIFYLVVFFFTTVLIYKLFSQVISQDLKLSLIIFSYFYLFYFYYPQFFLILANDKNIPLSSEIFVTNEQNFIKILSYNLSFFLIFFLGAKLTDLIFEKKNKFLIKIKTFFNEDKSIQNYYNNLIKIFLAICVFVFFINFSKVLLSDYSYQQNQITNVGNYSFLLDMIFFFLYFYCFINRKNYSLLIIILIFSIFFTFYTNNKDWLIFALVGFLTMFYNINKNLFTTTNLIIFLIFTFIFLFYFFPFFSVYRGSYDLIYTYNAIFKYNFRSIGDPGSSLAILYLLSNGIVKLEYFNFLYNLTSFLPSNFRLNDDYGIMFAKEILGNNLKTGQGFSFSNLAETIIYIKKYGLFFYFLIILVLGASYALFIKLIKFFTPINFNNFIIIFFSVFLSFIIVRSTTAGFFQFGIRYLIIIIILFAMTFLLRNIIYIIKKNVHKKK